MTTISQTFELKTLAELGIASNTVDRVDATRTNEGHDRGFAATFTRTLLPRLQLPTSNRRGSTGAAETIYFQTDRADSIAHNG